jgi:hypothetical protein
MLQRRAVKSAGGRGMSSNAPAGLPTYSEKVYPGPRVPTTVRHLPITAPSQ